LIIEGIASRGDISIGGVKLCSKMKRNNRGMNKGGVTTRGDTLFHSFQRGRVRNIDEE
jgi:hypothetical protein